MIGKKNYVSEEGFIIMIMVVIGLLIHLKMIFKKLNV
jgi:hypothetical protein